MESPQALAKIFPARPSEAESLQSSFSSPFSFLYAPFVVRFGRYASYDKTNKNILRRRLVAWHGFSRLQKKSLTNFFGKAQNKMANQQNTGNLINFVSEKS